MIIFKLHFINFHKIKQVNLENDCFKEIVIFVVNMSINGPLL